MALYVLGKHSEASQIIEFTLSQNPEAEMAHAAHGWLLLVNKKPDEAVLAFREALRLNPGCEWP